MHYDIIGDVHGQEDKLLRLLDALGYRKSSGVFRHPDRQAIFVGDFIDRGPAIRETLQIVRPMVESGAALAVVGNHELLALEHDQLIKSPRTATPGRLQYLNAVVRRSLEQFADHPAEWVAALEWFRHVPIYLDLGALRVVHAAWSDDAIACLAGRRTLDDLLPGAVSAGTGTHQAVRTLLFGWEVQRPGTTASSDLETAMRSIVRLAWWKHQEAPTYQSLSFPYDIDAPETPLPRDIVANIHAYPPDAPPLFFGHYGLAADTHPLPQTSNVACLDYRAAKGGPLMAYRWDGEHRLSDRKFAWTHR